MESYVFDIILITLAIVVLLHLVYNNSLFATQSSKSRHDENMKILRDLRKRDDYVIPKVYDDGEYRDPGTKGLDRTVETKKWYHVANRLVTDKTPDLDLDLNLDTAKLCKREKEAVQEISALMNGYNKTKTGKDYRLIFGDNYERKLTSDPMEANIPNIPANMEIPDIAPGSEKLLDANGNVCTLAESSQNMKRYIRDYVLDGNVECSCVVDKSTSGFTRTEVDNYRENQIRFRDKIFGSSDLALDPVDKMNLITLKEGVKANGSTVADFYDNIVSNKFSDSSVGSYYTGPGFIMGTSIPKTKCIRNPMIDVSTGVPQSFYQGSANADGKYMLRDNWMYNNENPNNGGIMFEGIRAEDPMMEYNRNL